MQLMRQRQMLKFGLMLQQYMMQLVMLQQLIQMILQHYRISADLTVKLHVGADATANNQISINIANYECKGAWCKWS